MNIYVKPHMYVYSRLHTFMLQSSLQGRMQPTGSVNIKLLFLFQQLLKMLAVCCHLHKKKEELNRQYLLKVTQ